ncbi:MAG: response regulator transcription factor [Acidimicrobiales bacterium]
MRILVVDDEPAVLGALDRALRLEGYEVDLAADGEAALRAVSAAAPDAIVLDVLMPRVDGLEVCRRLRAVGDQTPVLLLTARTAVADRVAGLDAGADDYLAKPFALEELLARLRALLRRPGATGGGPGSAGASAGDGAGAPTAGDGVLAVADLTLDTRAYQARRGGRLLELTRTEMALLELLVRNPDQVLTRDVIHDRVWGYDFGPSSNSLEVYIGYLRRKTEAGGEARLIHTVRGVGYVLRTTAPR